MIENIKTMERNMEVMKDKQKAYVDQRWKPLEFKEGYKVFLRATPSKGLR